MSPTSISSLKKSSLHRKDTMWIYKNPQGLQLLENELNERRKKRFARNRTSPSPIQKSVESPLVLSPKSIQPEQVIPVAIPTMTPVVKKPVKTTSKELTPTSSSINQLKQELENNAATIKVARPTPLKKEIQPLSNKNVFTNKDNNFSSSTSLKKELSPPVSPFIKESFTEIKTKPIDPSLLNKYNNNINKEKNIQSSTPNLGYKIDVPVKDIKNNFQTSQQKAPISATTSTVSKGLEARKQALFKVDTTDKSNVEIKSPTKEIQPQYILNTRRSSADANLKKEDPQPFNTTLKARPPPRVSSLPGSDTQKNNFLLEAKQKLFAVQQKQQQQQQQKSIVKKTLPITPPVKQQNGLVSSFISAFETTPTAVGPPPKLPQHFEMPSTPSVSTPLTPPPNKIVPVTSNSSMLPRQQSESYFSSVIDRRYNNISPAGSEDSIQMYLPQLSPELSFCNTSTLDIPDDEEEDDIGERPCIKKRVSFSEQLSTVIPDDESETTEEDHSTIGSKNSMARFTRTLSQELSETSTILAAEKKVNPSPREKYIPVPIVKKPAVVVRPSSNSQGAPQKLSNKLLDMFQKKPKNESKSSSNNVPIAVSSTPPKLTHLTKSRPRKPASLKKPTTLTYPAAIAQPDWRTRAIGSKNIYNPSS